MVISRDISFAKIMQWSGHHFLWLFAFVGGVALMYFYEIITFSIPWLPISVIGTAVAFYVGFKNNQAYDRMWEARKIWGGIVNESRTWAMMVDGFITGHFSSHTISQKDINQIKKRLIYRHIAWLYVHRSQLLVPTSWEHISQTGHMARTAEYYQQKFGIGLIDQESSAVDIKQFLPSEEYSRLMKSANAATQIINEQSRDLSALRENNLINDFRHMEMVALLKSLYECQGKNERIKKFPLPRQYANMSRYFVGFFIMLLPFSMVPELMKEDTLGLWISIPLTVLIGWIYVMMEIVGDYTENPFQGMANDIPMLSLCRTIEIDLRQMLGEQNLPPPIQPKNDILM